MEELQQHGTEDTPVWAVFGDLMSALVGVFVLILVWVLGYQLELSLSLNEEIQKREAAEEHRSALEQALAGPLASGRVTLRDGRIGISGSVLFALNSHQLQSEGRELLKTLVAPLEVYLEGRNDLLMVSGFTDDLSIQSDNLHYADNWELSAQRALTVTRALNSGDESTFIIALEGINLNTQLFASCRQRGHNVIKCFCTIHVRFT